MSDSSGEALRLITHLSEVDLPRFYVVGAYARYDEAVRNALKDARQKILAGLERQARTRENHLIWAAPGSGKTYFVDQIAAALSGSVFYSTLNLAKSTESDFRVGLQELEAQPRPCLCLIDEVDAKPQEPWPYEVLLPYLDAAVEQSEAWAFVLAGSSGASRQEMKRRIAERPKGADLLSRIPNVNEYEIPAMGIGDRLLVVLSQFNEAAREVGRRVEAVEKFGLYYVALTPYLGNARQLREFAVRAVQRMPPQEDRIKYDNLFDPGDPENKRFWAQAQDAVTELENKYVTLHGGTRPAATPPSAVQLHPPAGIPLLSRPLTQGGRDGVAGIVQRSPFVGRGAELGRLQSALDLAMAGRGSLVVIAGEPGIGKTALCQQLASDTTERGGQALWGHYYEEGPSLPYMAFVEALRTLVSTLSVEVLERGLGTYAPEVANIVPEMRQRSVVPLGLPGDPQEDRWRLFEGISSFLASVAAEQPLTLIIEDLQWADQDSLHLLTHLARHVDRTQLLVAATYRDVDVDRMHPLSNTLAELGRGPGFERVFLKGLPSEDVRSLAEGIAERKLTDDVAEAVHRQTEGNPLFVREMVRHLAEEGQLTRGSGESDSASEDALSLTSVPMGLREVIGKRLSRLGPECNRLLGTAAVIGEDFTYEVLGAVADVPQDVLEGSLDEAVAAALLEEEARSGVIRYRFPHALFRRVLYEELRATQRLRLHQRVGHILEQRYAPRLEEHAAELATHLGQSSDPADLAKAVEYLALARRKAQEQHAEGLAADFQERRERAVEKLFERQEEGSGGLWRARFTAGLGILGLVLILPIVSPLLLRWYSRPWGISDAVAVLPLAFLLAILAGTVGSALRQRPIYAVTIFADHLAIRGRQELIEIPFGSLTSVASWGSDVTYGFYAPISVLLFIGAVFRSLFLQAIGREKAIVGTPPSLMHTPVLGWGLRITYDHSSLMLTSVSAGELFQELKGALKKWAAEQGIDVSGVVRGKASRLGEQFRLPFRRADGTPVGLVNYDKLIRMVETAEVNGTDEVAISTDRMPQEMWLSLEAASQEDVRLWTALHPWRGAMSTFYRIGRVMAIVIGLPLVVGVPFVIFGEPSFEVQRLVLAGLYILAWLPGIALVLLVAGFGQWVQRRGRAWRRWWVQLALVTPAVTVAVVILVGTVVSLAAVLLAFAPRLRYPVAIAGRVLNGATPVANVPVADLSLRVNCVTALGRPCRFTFGFGAVTGGDGSFTLYGEPGRYDLFVRSGGAGVSSTRSTHVDATTSSRLAGQDIQVASASSTVTGTVAGLAGAPVAGAIISVNTGTEGRTVTELAACRTCRFPIATAITDNNGRYSLAVAPGTYSATASRSGYQVQVLDVVIVSDTGLVQDFTLVNMPFTPTTTPASGYVGRSVHSNDYFADIQRAEIQGSQVRVFISAYGLSDLQTPDWTPDTSCLIESPSGNTQRSVGFVASISQPGRYEGYLEFPSAFVKTGATYAFRYRCQSDYTAVQLPRLR